MIFGHQYKENDMSLEMTNVELFIVIYYFIDGAQFIKKLPIYSVFNIWEWECSVQYDVLSFLMQCFSLYKLYNTTILFCHSIPDPKIYTM